MPYQTLNVDYSNPALALLRLNRPEAANALNTRMAVELTSVFKHLGKKSSRFKVVVLTGSGRYFCAGADLKERRGMTKKAWGAQHAAFEKALYAILGCPIPVIAAVNGAAMGGGLELALACDFILASEGASLAFPEAGLGIMPGLGGTQTLPRAVGPRRAKELLFSGKRFSAEDACRWGLVNRSVPAESLLQETLTLAETIAGNAPLSVRAIKQSVNQGIALPLKAALQCELKHYKTLLNTGDRHEGIHAFNEKRKPAFTGK